MTSWEEVDLETWKHYTPRLWCFLRGHRPVEGAELQASVYVLFLLKMADTCKRSHMLTRPVQDTHTDAQTSFTSYIYIYIYIYHCATHANWQTGRSQQTYMCHLVLSSSWTSCGPQRDGDKDFVMKLLVNLAAPVLSPPRRRAQNATYLPPTTTTTSLLAAAIYSY